MWFSEAQSRCQGSQEHSLKIGISSVPFIFGTWQNCADQLKGAVSGNSAKLGYCKMPVKLKETQK